MRIEENAGGGDTVYLSEGDSLDEVPESHVRLVTPAIHIAFKDPCGYFGNIAARSLFGELSSWLLTVIKANNWELELNIGFPYGGIDRYMTGFHWSADGVQEATLSLPVESNEKVPVELAKFYELVGAINWTCFGGAGGIEAIDDHTPVSEFAYLFADSSSIPKDRFVFGSSGCGDMLTYAESGSAAWLSHENGSLRELGSIKDAINWVFREMSHGRTPEYPYS